MGCWHLRVQICLIGSVLVLTGLAPFAALDAAKLEIDGLDNVGGDFAYNAFDVKQRGWPRFETGCAGTVVAYEQQGLKAGALQRKQIELATKAPKLVNIDYAMNKAANVEPRDDDEDEDSRPDRLLQRIGRSGQEEGPIDFASQFGDTKPAQYLCQIKEEISAARFTGKGDEVKVKALLDQFEANVRTALQEAQRKNWEKKYQMPPRSHQWHRAVAKDQRSNMGFGMDWHGGSSEFQMQLLFSALVCDAPRAPAPPATGSIATTTTTYTSTPATTAHGTQPSPIALRGAQSAYRAPAPTGVISTDAHAAGAMSSPAARSTAASSRAGDVHGALSA